MLIIRLLSIGLILLFCTTCSSKKTNDDHWISEFDQITNGFKRMEDYKIEYNFANEKLDHIKSLYHINDNDTIDPKLYYITLASKECAVDVFNHVINNCNSNGFYISKGQESYIDLYQAKREEIQYLKLDFYNLNGKYVMYSRIIKVSPTKYNIRDDNIRNNYNYMVFFALYDLGHESKERAGAWFERVDIPNKSIN